MSRSITARGSCTGLVTVGPTKRPPVWRLVLAPLAINSLTTVYISPCADVERILHHKCTICWRKLDSSNVYKSIIWHWCRTCLHFSKSIQKNQPWIKAYENPCSASGGLLIPQGNYIIPLEFEGAKILQQVQVYSKLQSDAILGSDVIKNLGIPYL